MREEIMFKNKKNEKTNNINNDKIKEQKNVLMDEGEKKERKIMKRIALVCVRGSEIPPFFICCFPVLEYPGFSNTIHGVSWPFRRLPDIRHKL